MDLDLENFEIPACALTGKRNFTDFSAGALHLNLAPPIRVAQCRDTGMLYLCPRPNRKNRELMLQGVLPEALREYGVKTYNYASVEKLRASDFEKRMELVNGRFAHEKERTVLDVGTSGGVFMEVATKAGWKASGIEPFEGDVALCRSKGLDVVHGFAEKLPYADNSFHVVHTSHVFEHLEDPLIAAREAYRVLKPGGLLFIEVPNQLDNFGFNRDRLFHAVKQRKRDITSIHHLWFFGRKTLNILFEKAGFERIEIRNRFPRPFGGWRYPFSLASQMLARTAFGSYIINGYGHKPG